MEHDGRLGAVSAVLLDMDGTLVDSDAAVERAWRAWAAEYDVDLAEVLAIAHGTPAERTVGAMLPDLSPDEVARAAAHQLMLQYDDLSDVVPTPGATRLISVLARRTMPWAVVTSADRRLAHARLHAAGIPVPVLVTSEDVAAGKPAPDAYLLAARTLGVEASACLVVEDAEAGLQAGRAAGARTAALKGLDGDIRLSDLEELADLLDAGPGPRPVTPCRPPNVPAAAPRSGVDRPWIRTTTDDSANAVWSQLASSGAARADDRRRPEPGGDGVNTPPIVSPEEWQTAWENMLVREKEVTRTRDALAAERRRMPWMAVEKDYRFEGPDGPLSLLGLFDGRRQLVVYRAFYAPDVTTYPATGGAYPERACVGCSFGADQVAHPAHLNARDTTLAFVSRAPQSEIQGLKERMGWQKIPWYTLTDDFDADFGVSEWHGTNAFIREGDDIYRTYFINSRGDEAMGSTWAYLDITALGRQEEWEDSPDGYPQTPPYGWWTYHDAYGKDT